MRVNATSTFGTQARFENVNLFESDASFIDALPIAGTGAHESPVGHSFSSLSWSPLAALIGENRRDSAGRLSRRIP